ncbi:ATPase, T2SS/T4P/T4SS family, partial [Enterobacter hormaechei]|uniref:ATPase, T2SS/T4P/T4SS family n=1 Tax=Enterobacter hormaechei TaxID=158836 RepID=UPI0020403626
FHIPDTPQVLVAIVLVMMVVATIGVVAGVEKGIAWLSNLNVRLLCGLLLFVLVTGPTGSGKTTTLYSTLKRLATPDVNVCTVEDPIEMIAPEFNQMQVQANIDLDFASGVRTLLRQDPDIIMIGE